MKTLFKKDKKNSPASKKTTAYHKRSLKDTLRVNLLPTIFLSYTLIVLIVFSVISSGGISFGQHQTSITDDTPRFIGTWTYQSSQESFNSDGSYVVDTFKVGTWKVSNGKLSITYGTSSTSIDYSYVFSNNDKTLTLTGLSSGITKIYTR
ncbi:MAG: hypothetical protein QXL17_05175 [Candidatus Thermoplasmatota archaeon]